MSTWALLHQGELGPFLEHEKPIWPFGANSWNIPNSPGTILITTRSRTAAVCLVGLVAPFPLRVAFSILDSTSTKSL